MKDKLAYYVSLLKRQITGELTPARQKEAEELLQDERWRTAFDSLNQEEFLKEKAEEYRLFSPEKAFRKFRAEVTPGIWRKRMVRFTAAAALVAISAGIVFWLRDSDKKERGPVMAKKEVIEPGTKKALLKLADGSVVNVTGDSMQILDKKGAEISFSGGEITYKPQKEITHLVYNELIVPVAGECYLVLDDGTRVWLNSDTKLKYPLKFVGKERKVFLEGEAYFEVTKDAKPFIVHTVLGEVNVLGTRFNVKAYQEEERVYTTLVSGKVNFKGKETIEIKPGEQVVAFNSGRMEKRMVDISEFTGWKEGLYVFRKQTLESIMNDLARWYGIVVFYRNPELKKMTFTGNLKRYDSINTFMNILERTGDVKYNVSGNTIVLYR